MKAVKHILSILFVIFAYDAFVTGANLIWTVIWLIIASIVVHALYMRD